MCRRWLVTLNRYGSSGSRSCGSGFPLMADMHTTTVIWNPRSSIKAQGIRSQLTNTAGDTPVTKAIPISFKIPVD